jgi:hypothetical protein
MEEEEIASLLVERFSKGKLSEFQQGNWSLWSGNCPKQNDL